MSDRPTTAAIRGMKEVIVEDLTQVRVALYDEFNALDPIFDEHMTSIETFVAIALEVFAVTNPSKLRDAMRVVEIRARIDGKKVFE